MNKRCYCMFDQHLTSINNITVIVVVAGGGGNHYILCAKIYCFLSVAIVVVVVVVIVCYYYYYYSSDFCNIVSNLQMDPAAAYRNGGVQNFFFHIDSRDQLQWCRLFRTVKKNYSNTTNNLRFMIFFFGSMS